MRRLVLVIVFDYPSNVSNCARRHPKDHLYFQPYTKIQQLSFLIALVYPLSSKIISLLLLEPDRATRQLYARELGKRWRVIAVERATEMLDILKAEMIDAVILEVADGGAEQWQLLGKVRMQAKDAALPIIICSAIDERGKGYEAGASAYLVKPVSPQQLTGEVAQWVEGQSRASVTS